MLKKLGKNIRDTFNSAAYLVQAGAHSLQDAYIVARLERAAKTGHRKAFDNFVDTQHPWALTHILDKQLSENNLQAVGNIISWWKDADPAGHKQRLADLTNIVLHLNQPAPLEYLLATQNVDSAQVIDFMKHAYKPQDGNYGAAQQIAEAVKRANIDLGTMETAVAKEAADAATRRAKPPSTRTGRAKIRGEQP